MFFRRPILPPIVRVIKKTLAFVLVLCYISVYEETLQLDMGRRGGRGGLGACLLARVDSGGLKMKKERRPGKTLARPQRPRLSRAGLMLTGILLAACAKNTQGDSYCLAYEPIYLSAGDDEKVSGETIKAITRNNAIYDCLCFDECL